MTLADVLDGMFRLFLSHWRTYALALAIIVVPLNIVTALLTAQLGLTGGILEQLNNPAATEAALQAGPDVFALAALGVISVVGAIFITPFLTGLCCRIAGDIYEGGNPEPRDALRETRGRYWTLVCVTLLIGLIGLGIIALPLALGVAGAVTDTGPLLVVAGLLGVVAFVVLIWLSVRLTLAYAAAAIEPVGARTALRRSYDLVKGRWWRVFGTMFLAQIIAGIVSFIAGIPFSLPGNLFGGVIAALLVGIGQIIATIVTTPLVANAQTLLYYDGRVRSEGYDVELLARGVAGGQPSGAQGDGGGQSPPPAQPGAPFA